MNWNDILQPALGVLATAIASLLVGILAQYLRKIGIQLDADQQAKLEYFVRQAVLRVEEWARAQQKAGKAVTSDEKLVAAQNEVLARFPGLDPVTVTRQIQAALPVVRAAVAA